VSTFSGEFQTKIFLQYAFICLGSLAAQGNDPVKVTLEGTSIERLPLAVTIFTETPAKLQKEFVERGATRPIHLGDSEVYDATKNGVHYLFLKIDDATAISKSVSFSQENVIYHFDAESVAEIQQKSKQHSLTQVESTTTPTGRKTVLFRASKGYFVSLTVPGTRHICAMHPHVTGKPGEKCEICQLNLIPVKE